MREQSAANPIKATPRPNKGRESMGAEKMTQAKATMPTSAPSPATRWASAPRVKRRAANVKPAPPPSASIAVNAVVAPTGRCRIFPP